MLQDAVDLKTAVVGTELEVEGSSSLVEEEPWMDELSSIRIWAQINVGPQLLQFVHGCAGVVGVFGKDERNVIIVT